MNDIKDTPDMEEVYRVYYPVVYNYIFYKLLSKENTEDVVSQIFMKVLRNLHHFDSSKSSLKTWIFRIANNTLIDYYRARRTLVSIDDESANLNSQLSVHFDEQYDQMISPIRQETLKALQYLSERERLFIYYKYYLNTTNRKIAQDLGMKENTVSAILSRARHKLKALLEDQL